MMSCVRYGVHTRSRRAISLMEVVLALAILAIASAYLAQAMQIAAQNAIRAQRLTQAELVAESVMNQVVGGLIPAQPVTWTPYISSATSSNWNYSLSIVPAEIQGIIGIQVGVQEPVAGAVPGAQPADLIATRWIIDPSLGLDTMPEEEPVEEEAAGGSGQAAGQGQAGQGQAGQGGQGQGGQGQGGFGGGGGRGGGSRGGDGGGRNFAPGSGDNGSGGGNRQRR